MPKVGGTKDVNLAKLRRLAPTHVLVNVDENRRETVEAIRAWGAAAPEIVVTHPLRSGRQPGAGRRSWRRCSRGAPGVAARAARPARTRWRDELAATRAEGRAEQPVLYLIWHDPWMTVARDTYLSRMLARIGWQTLPAVERRRRRRGALPGRCAATSPGSAASSGCCSAPSRSPSRPATSPRRRRCARARSVQRVDGELLSWYGAARRGRAALSARAGATTIGSRTRLSARHIRRWTS